MSFDCTRVLTITINDDIALTSTIFNAPVSGGVCGCSFESLQVSQTLDNASQQNLPCNKETDFCSLCPSAAVTLFVVTRRCWFQSQSTLTHAMQHLHNGNQYRHKTYLRDTWHWRRGHCRSSAAG